MQETIRSFYAYWERVMMTMAVYFSGRWKKEDKVENGRL